MIRHYVAIICELFAAKSAFASLGDDFFIEELSHFRIGAEFPVPPLVEWILDPADAKLSSGRCLLYHFSPAAGKGTMNRADLVAAKSHDFPPDYD